MLRHVLPRVPIPPKPRKRVRPIYGWWNVDLPPIPEELKTVPGIWRDAALEEEAAIEAPLYSFDVIHRERALRGARRRRSRLFALQIAPRRIRWVRACKRTALVKIRTRPSSNPEQLKRELFAEAERIGLGAIGVAKFNPKYQFKDYAGTEKGDRIIVCALEQHYDASQTLPSMWAQKAQGAAYAENMKAMVSLAKLLHRHGYEAHAEENPGMSVDIYYGVEAGLGQLGLNGQLLTPAAGSRIRLGLISTNAPLPFDEPVDYGIHGLCDRCQICVQRCPARAIPTKRDWYRGVMKAKINMALCMPVHSQSGGCSICMTTCPVQKFGLKPVLDEYISSGEILGKHSEELEGYDMLGRHWSAEERPRFHPEFFDIKFDAHRKTPVGTTADDELLGHDPSGG
jgi:epoxyqueuosine reductase